MKKLFMFFLDPFYLGGLTLWFTGFVYFFQKYTLCIAFFGKVVLFI